MPNLPWWICWLWLPKVLWTWYWEAVSNNKNQQQQPKKGHSLSAQAAALDVRMAQWGNRWAKKLFSTVLHIVFAVAFIAGSVAIVVLALALPLFLWAFGQAASF